MIDKAKQAISLLRTMSVAELHDFFTSPYFGEHLGLCGPSTFEQLCLGHDTLHVLHTALTAEVEARRKAYTQHNGGYPY